MVERIKKIEKEIEVIRFAFDQNKLFLESNNEVIIASTEMLKIIPDFMMNTSKRIEELENLIEAIQEVQESQNQAIQVMGRNIQHIVDIIT